MSNNEANVSGIYQIANLRNNKSYIGLSIDISNRWKQHTYRVQEDESPKSRIRAALKKYGLNKTVYRSGRYGDFEFKIIEQCEEEKLIEREKYWIEKIKPEYNCDLLTLPEYYKSNHPKNRQRRWIQYHNYEKENSFPSQDALNKNTKLYDAHHYISSRKRSILYSKGDIIYLILGIGKRNKSYYLWSRTKVEEVDFIEEEDLIYNAFGDQFYLEPPQVLNDRIGFYSFQKYCGNFGLGFMNISEHEFAEDLEKIAKRFRLWNDSIFFHEYIENFKKHL